MKLENLTADQVVNGFRVVSLYLNDEDRPMGGRFIHEQTGFTLDLLQIQSVPQSFIWVNTFPTSDMGEPHTQEHLLLGKGNKGRAVASLEDMSLAGSSAFTMQWRTCYHFHTAAGADVYYQLLERQLDALIYPDYTDEEIRREVRNFGITESPIDGSARLEEKGSVYNEMVSSFTRPWALLGRTINLTLYGPDHPLSYSSGGLPAAIREMRPEHIRRFHRENYHLANMGMVGSYPKDMPLTEILTQLDGILGRVQNGQPVQRDIQTIDSLPKAKVEIPSTLQIVDYPHKNDQQPGPLVFVWPAILQLDNEEQLLLELFIENLAGDPTTNLYKKFIDSKTRVMDLGARGVFGWVVSEAGHPIYLGLSDVAPIHFNPEKIEQVRAKIVEEIAAIAAWPDDAGALQEFNTRLLNRIVESKRDTNKFIDSPPGFGFRSSGASWMLYLDRLARTSDFRKSVTNRPALEFVERLIAGKQNFWRDYIPKWHLLDTVPYAGAARANPEMIAQEDVERQQRIDAELARLKQVYQVDDDQAAICRYRSEYDQATAELDQLEQQSTSRFLENPPLTLDDQLDYQVSTLPGDITLVASTFDNMSSATIGLALRLDGVPAEQLFYLSMLPSLLTRVGVIADGQPISYEEMSELMRKEILALNAYFTNNYRTERCELVVRGSGNDPREAKRAVDWMQLVLFTPDWRPENLPRIRDLVDQMLSGFRNTMQGAEESWVNNPAGAYRKQDNPLLLATDSFLTRTHNIQRLRWLLKDTGNQPKAIADYLAQLAGAVAATTKESSHSELKQLLATLRAEKPAADDLPEPLKPYQAAFLQLPIDAQALALEAAKDLEQLLTETPDTALALDWDYLCRQMQQDLLKAPAEVLTELDNLRRQLLKTGNARMFMIGSRANQTALADNIQALVGNLHNAPASPIKYQQTPLIKQRLRQRLPEAENPLFIGLLNPNGQGGVFLNSAPITSYYNLDREAILEYLAAKLYGGGGAHGIFMKTWGAGLAYSNGLGSSPAAGRISYYAERTPELPQTLRFVIAELQRAPRDPALVEYAIAQAFSEFRSASGYEARGEAMAADLVDGLTPEVVSNFRKAILALRPEPNLAEELYQRMDQVYARVLPGYQGKASAVSGAIYFVIGPEKQFQAYEQYLKSIEGPQTRLYRLYPRDYWMTF